MVRRFNDRSGFSLTELIVVIAVVGILAAIMIPKLGGVKGEAELSVVVDQTRSVQGIAAVYYAEHLTVPTIQDIDAVYTRNGHESLVGKFAVIPVGDGSALSGAKSGSDASTAQRYVICSLMKIHKAAYVYGSDDNKPQVAPVGSDPVGSGHCGGGSSSVTTTDPVDTDTGPTDTGPTDTGPTDTGPTDTGTTDTGTTDTGTTDTGPTDSGPTDSGVTDTGTTDTSGSDTPADVGDTGSSDDHGSSDGDDDHGDHDSGDHDSDDGVCDLDAMCPRDAHWGNHGEYASCLAHAQKECNEHGLHLGQRKDCDH